jgi:hypothetical protein
MCAHTTRHLDAVNMKIMNIEQLNMQSIQTSDIDWFSRAVVPHEALTTDQQISNKQQARKQESKIKIKIKIKNQDVSR